jgi:hypothetical protein
MNSTTRSSWSHNAIGRASAIVGAGRILAHLCVWRVVGALAKTRQAPGVDSRRCSTTPAKGLIAGLLHSCKSARVAESHSRLALNSHDIGMEPSDNRAPTWPPGRRIWPFCCISASVIRNPKLHRGQMSVMMIPLRCLSERTAPHEQRKLCNTAGSP